MSYRTLHAEQIASLIPHRGLALFLQSAQVDGMVGTGKACWPLTHPHIAGHFPGLPIVPGIFLIEAFAQLAGVVVTHAGFAGVGQVGVLSGLRKVLIHRPVLPEETIEFQLSIPQAVDGRFFIASGGARNQRQEKVLTIDATLALVERAELEPVYAVA